MEDQEKQDREFIVSAWGLLPLLSQVAVILRVWWARHVRPKPPPPEKVPRFKYLHTEYAHWVNERIHVRYTHRYRWVLPEMIPRPLRFAVQSGIAALGLLAFMPPHPLAMVAALGGGLSVVILVWSLRKWRKRMVDQDSTI